MPKQITIEIPDGDYCGNCPMLRYEDIALVNPMGDPTGNRKQYWWCNQYRATLEGESCGCCCGGKVKKCLACKGIDPFGSLMALMLLVALNTWGGAPPKEDA